MAPVQFCVTQMTGEMNTLRNKRIELLKGMKGVEKSMKRMKLNDFTTCKDI